MAIQPIVLIGNASLLETSLPVEDFQSPELLQLIQDLQDTQHHLGGAGIAAPQIGVNLRVIRIGFKHCARYPERQPVEEMILINPEFEPLSESHESAMERCLSIPERSGLVSRYKKIRYWGYDIKGEKIAGEAENFHARMIQHEIDHLNGILIVDRFEKSL